MKNSIFFAILFISLLSGCQKSPPPQSTLRLNFHSEPNSLDPRTARDLPSLTVARMLFDGLFRPHESGVLPSLAKSFTVSADKLTYFFELKSSCWSDGSSVTAKDFEMSIKSILSPDFPAEEASILFVIEGAKAAKLGHIPTHQVAIQAIGQHGLQIKLSHPDPYFFERLAHPIAYPVPYKKALSDPNWAQCQRSQFISNGPFSVKTYIPGDHLVLEKNPTYWDKSSVQLQCLAISFIEDEHTELNMYENDELDWAGSPNSSIPLEALPSLKQVKPDELFILPLISTYCYKFNTQAPPFNNQKIREAFSRAIEKQSLIENVLQAGQQAACHLIPPSLGIHRESLAATTSPRLLFEQGLKEMGWDRSTLPAITLTYSKSEKHQKIAQAIQQQWNQTFGIKINLQSYEWNTFLNKLATGDYQVGGRGWVSELSDPKAFLEIYQYDNTHELGAGNDTGWEDPEFIRLLELADKTADEIARNKLIADAEKRLLASSVIAPVFHSAACYLKKPYVKGVQMTPLCDLDFKQAYIEMDL